MTYPNGDKYEETGRMVTPWHGQMTYPNGDKYEGDWQNEAHGKGALTCSNGDKYEGDWQDDNPRHGHDDVPQRRQVRGRLAER